MKGTRKSRDEAIERILAMLAEHRGTRFRTSYLASTLQLGRERIIGLLRDLQAEGQVVSDARGWFVSLGNGEPIPESPRQSYVEPRANVETWIAIGHIGRGVKITVEFEAKP